MMKIPGSTIRLGQKAYIDKASEGKRAGSAGKAPSGGKVATDTVSISDTSKEIRQTASLPSASPASQARVERIASLKRAISEGTYKVDPDKVADAIISEVLDGPA
jgi:flagellar biosynthesis anti-sigma factor FlgM